MVGLAPLNCTKGVKDFRRLEHSFAFFVVGLNIFVDVEIFSELLTTCFIFLLFIVFALLLPWSTSLLHLLSLPLSLSLDYEIELKFWPRFIWREFIKPLFMWAMHVWHSGEIADFGIPCLFTKKICLFFYFQMILIILRDIRCCFSFTPSNLQISDMQSSFFLPRIFSTFLSVSFSNFLSVFFKRLSSFFFSFFFWHYQQFLSIKVDWNLLPGT